LVVATIAEIITAAVIGRKATPVATGE